MALEGLSKQGPWQELHRQPPLDDAELDRLRKIIEATKKLGWFALMELLNYPKIKLDTIKLLPAYRKALFSSIVDIIKKCNSQKIHLETAIADGKLPSSTQLRQMITAGKLNDHMIEILRGYGLVAAD